MKALSWIGGFFAAFGLVFAAIGGWFLYDDQQLADRGLRAEGRVVSLQSSRDSDGDTTYRPVVEYRDEGGRMQRFTSSMGSSPPAYSRGEDVDVIYDPADPTDAMIDGFTDRYLFPLIFGGMGLLFAAIGFAMVGFRIRRKRIIAHLKERGMRIEAELLEVFLDTSIKVNGRSPYRVAAQAVHPATGKMQRFESDGIWINPTGLIGDSKVPILLDPARPKRSYFDLSQWVDDSERA